MAVIDPLFCRTMPPDLTIASGVDALAHCIEGYVSLATPYHPYFESIVIGEITYYKRNGVKYFVDFRSDYIQKKSVIEISASAGDVAQLSQLLPGALIPTIHPGEFESLAIMLKKSDLIFCSCDAATIRVLPILDLSERGISAEKLLQESGLSTSGLQDRHTEKYFKNNLAIGQENKVYSFQG